ncbi:MAG: P-II family nitrogen regulator [Bdellovibrionales bacterium]
MKEVRAFIKEFKLADVIWALHAIDGLSGVTMTEVYGYGRGKALNSEDKVKFISVDSLHGVKLEIACKDELVDQVVSTIQKAAHTGLRGDGKIYVSEILKAVRISTNETGEAAV